MDDVSEVKKRLGYIISLIESTSKKPIITNSMIKNGIAEYLFSPDLREFTLEHFDMSYITKAALKKLSSD